MEIIIVEQDQQTLIIQDVGVQGPQGIQGVPGTNDLNGTLPIVYTQLTENISILPANATQAGYLSASDFVKIQGALQDPTTTAGDMVYRDGSGAIARLPAGSNGKVLQIVSGVPSWQTIVYGVSSFNGRTGAVIPQLGDYSTSTVAEGSNLYFTTSRVQDYLNTQVGYPNGIASLDGTGKVPIGQIPVALIGAVSYQGTWNASTNSPALTSGVGVKGYYYVVSVAGSTNLDGVTSWNVGDWVVFNGTVWQRVDNTQNVQSVNGLTGAVVLTTSNINEGTNLYFTDARARLALSASSPILYNNLTGQISAQYASASQPGVISASDYINFSAGGSAITALTGDATASGPGSAVLTLASVGTPGTYTKVTTDSKGRVTSGGALSVSDIPGLPASIITSGTLGTAFGGTGRNTIGSQNQILGVNAGGTALEYKTITAGSGIAISNAPNSVTIAVNPSTLSGFANDTLSNLASPTSINQDLIPSSAVMKSLGATGTEWLALWVGSICYGGIARYDVANGQLYDNASNVVLDLNNYRINYSGMTVIDWASQTLQDNNGAQSVAWTGRVLTDALGNNALDWGGRQAFDQTSVLSFDFSSRQLFDSNAIQSMNWQNRELNDAFGVTALQYGNRFLYNSSNAITVDWNSSQLISSGNLVFDWASSRLYSSSGILSLDASARKLYDNGGAQIADYSGPTFSVSNDLQAGGDLLGQVARVQNVQLTGTAGSGLIEIPAQTVAPSQPTSGLRLYANGTNDLSWRESDGWIRTFASTATGNRTYTLQNASGTLAFLSDIPSLTSVWSFNGNTVGSLKTLGTIDNFALPIITNNTERMRITATGNVGIGTNAPGTLLDVAGVASIGDSASSTAQVIIRGGASGGAMWQLQRTSGVTTTFSFALNGGGLSVSDDVNSVVVANFFGNTTANQLFLGQQNKTVTDTRTALLSATTFASSAGSNISAGNLVIQAGMGTGTGNPGDIQFNTGAGQASGSTQHTSTTRMTLKANSGNLGIGVANPVCRLVIGGNVATSAWGATGIQFQTAPTLYTDTSSTGTVASNYINVFGQPSLASTNAVTYTNSATLYVNGPPLASTNVTLTNAYTAYFNGATFTNGLATMLNARVQGTGNTLAFNQNSGGITWWNTADETTNTESFKAYFASNTFQLIVASNGTGTARPLLIGALGGGIGTTYTPFPASTVARIQDSAGTQASLASIGIMNWQGGFSASSGISPIFVFAPSYSGSGTSGFTGVQISANITGTGSGAYRLLDVGTNSASTGNISTHTSKFYVGSDGTLTIAQDAQTSASPNSIINLSSTWNTAGTPNFINATVTNTAVSGNPKWLNLTAGTSNTYMGVLATAGSIGEQIIYGTNGTNSITIGVGNGGATPAGTNYFRINSVTAIAFSSSAVSIPVGQLGLSGTAGSNIIVGNQSAGTASTALKLGPNTPSAGGMTMTSGNQVDVQIGGFNNYNFSPTSGTANYTQFVLTPTINQTGGANGITRSIYVNPTLTAVADYRAIEVANGNSFFGVSSGGVGVGTSSIVASATVQINSTTKGFLPPRMTTAQRTAISSPATGLEVYDTDLACPCFYDGTNWRKVSHSLA